MIFEMNDPQTGPIGAALNEAYKNEKFHGHVNCTMETTDGKWKLYIRSVYPQYLVEFVAHMHYAMPATETAIPAQSQNVPDPDDTVFGPSFAAQNSYNNLSQATASAPVQEAAPSPLEGTEQDEDLEDEESDEDATESAEAGQDGADKPAASKPVIRLPKANKGNVQRTGHSAVTIEG